MREGMLKTFGIFALALCLLGMTHAAEAVIVLDAFSAQAHTTSQNDAPPTAQHPLDFPFSFIIRNGSDPGVHITSVLLTLFNDATHTLFFDTANPIPGATPSPNFAIAPAGTYSAGFNLVLAANSGVTTGYTWANTIADGATSFLMTFNSFDPGDVFGFTADVDKGNLNGDRGITAEEWNHSMVTVDFDNGEQIIGTWNFSPSEFHNRDYGLGPLSVNHDTSTPEPSSLGLMGVGLLGLWKRRNKNKKAALSFK